MITIIIPGDFLQERAYALHVLFYEFLGLQYNLRVDPASDHYIISFQQKQIRIQDAFFGLQKASGTYLKAELIPTGAVSAKNPDLDNVICLYGNDRYTSDSNSLECGVDLIAGSFFMLARWEEFVLPQRDKHGRFPGTASLALKAGFLHRPVVNEYARLLKKWLQRIGVSESAFRQRRFSLALHCDVDTALYYPPRYSVLRKVMFRLLKERSVSNAMNELSAHKHFRETKRDPYDTYDMLMALAERNGTKASFCFLVNYNHPFDSRQTLDVPHVRRIFEHIRSRGHETGIHFSYRTADQTHLFPQEMKLFESVSGESAHRGRQHYLRCHIPQTWRGWESAKVSGDYTMGYPESPGFRCGSCYPFPLFDIEGRRMLHVYEHPLIAMDVTFRMYQNSSPGEAIEECRKLMRTVREHDGEFVFLWHNSSFALDWKEWEEVPSKVLNQ